MAVYVAQARMVVASSLIEVLGLGALVIYLDRQSLFSLTAWVEDDGLLPDAEINRMYWWHVIE